MNLTTLRTRLASVQNLSELARRSGVSLRNLRRIKNGHGGCTVLTVERIAAGLRRK